MSYKKDKIDYRLDYYYRKFLEDGAYFLDNDVSEDKMLKIKIILEEKENKWITIAEHSSEFDDEIICKWLYEMIINLIKVFGTLIHRTYKIGGYKK